MWQELRATDKELALRCIEIMHEVDRAYRGLGPAFLTSRIKTEQAVVFYYQQGEDEGLFVLQPNRRLGLFRVFTAGYRGPSSPAVMARVFLQQQLRFMREQCISEVYGIHRRDLDNPRMNEFFDALYRQPEIEVTVTHDMRDRSACRARLVSAMA